jgi:hypothetical protein
MIAIATIHRFVIGMLCLSLGGNNIVCSFCLVQPTLSRDQCQVGYQNYNTRSILRMSDSQTTSTTRRGWFENLLVKTGVIAIGSKQIFWDTSELVSAKPDCYSDCNKNCKLIAPKDDIYCQESCTEYCSQEDRQDGLSGSMSAEKGEVGILGGSFGTGTVVKGQDKPPTLGRIPGLDFTSESGKKLLGY